MKNAARARVAILVCVALLATLVPAMPAAASPGVSVTIAVAAPLTQGATALGNGIVRGARAAAAHYNASQDFIDLGLHVDVTAWDDQGDPRQAVMNADRIRVNTSALGVVGHLNSGCSIPAAGIYAENDIAMISPSSTNPILTQLGLDNVFRTMTTDDQQASFGAFRAADGLLLRRAVVVDDATPYGEMLANGFAVTFGRRHGTVIAHYKSEDTQTDFSSLVTKIKAQRPDVVYYGGIYNAAGYLSRQLKAAGVRVPFFGGDGLYDPAYIKRIGTAAAEGDYCTSTGLDQMLLPKRDRLVSEYASVYPGVSIAAYDAYAYDAASALCEAILRVARANGVSTLGDVSHARPAVRAEVAKTNLDGITGHVAFDTHGDTTNKACTLYRVRSGGWDWNTWRTDPVRVYGTDRYGTSIAVSRRSFPSTAAAVVLATGADFPDALSAGPLARAYGGPVLLVPKTGLTAALKSEIERLAPKDVFIIGSDQAVPSSVATIAAALPSAPAVTRLEGQDRFETAAAVATQLKTKRGTIEKVVVVTGYDYPDALSVAPLAASKGWPILLSLPAQLPTATAAAIADTEASSSVIVGSEKVVAPSVEASLPAATRLKGDDRYGTCAAVAAYACSNGLSAKYLACVKGDGYADALAAGPLVAARGGLLVMMRTTGVSSSLTSFLLPKRTQVKAIDIIGASGVLSDYAVSRLLLQL